MKDMHDVTIEFPVHFTRGAAGRKEVNVGLEPVVPTVERGCVPRVARLMALAIRFEELVRTGEVESHADLARLGQVTRARISQIMDLLCLAPDIQEDLLFLPRVERERDAVSEHELRVVCAVSDWREQRRRWRALHVAYRTDVSPADLVNGSVEDGLRSGPGLRQSQSSGITQWEYPVSPNAAGVDTVMNAMYTPP